MAPAPRCRLASPRPVRLLALIVLAGGVSTAISASIGVGSLLLAGKIAGGELPSVWYTWWLGDMGGDLVVAPTLLVCITQWPFRQAPGRPLEATLVAFLLVGVGTLVFSQNTPLTFLVFPPLIWATLRFWQPGATVGTLLLAGIAVTFTAHNVGPFSGHLPDERLRLAQTFVGVAGLTALSWLSASAFATSSVAMWAVTWHAPRSTEIWRRRGRSERSPPYSSTWSAPPRWPARGRRARW